jgi:hypothetical protein
VRGKKSTASSTLIASTSPMCLPRQVHGQRLGVEARPRQVSQGTFTSGRKLISIFCTPWPSQAGQRPPAVLKEKREAE